MSVIRVNLTYPIEDGLQVTFKAPCDSNQATGIKIYYPVVTEQGESTANQTFTFGDSATYNIGGTEHLFVTGAYVSVILDTTNNRAYLQNGDTNHYLEAVLEDLSTAVSGKAPTSHASSATTYGTGTSANYGHVKLSDATNSTSSTSGGIAATPAAVKSAYDLANGKAPKAHASTATTYGIGTSSNYGHVKLSDSTSSTSAASAGIAASPKAVKAAYDLANGAAKVQTGSYTGTGTFGSSQKNSLTFNFVPKLVVFSSPDANYKPIYVSGASKMWAFYQEYSDYRETVTCSLSSKTLSWYTTSSSSSYGKKFQGNNNGSTYYWVAIG